MAQKPDIQYIHQFYVPGSEARVLELKPVRKQNKKKFIPPLPQQEKKIVVAVDAASVFGIVMACVMMTLMLAGISWLSDAYADYRNMESYAIAVQNENVALQERYRSEVDLDAVREVAIGMGMVPIEDVEMVCIDVEEVTREVQVPWWEEVRWYLSQLFA